MAQLGIQRQFAFSGDRVEFVDCNTALYVHGNGLATLDILSLENQQFLPNTLECPLGISAFATNADNNIIAIAPRAAQPSIHIYKYPGVVIEKVLQQGKDLEYRRLAISHDATRLCAISGPFDSHLYLWSLETTDIISVVQIDLGAVTSCTWQFLSFDPKNPLSISAAGSNGLVIWKVEKVIDGHQLQKLNNTLPGAYLIGDGLQTNGNNNAISALCWTQNDLVIAVNTTHIVMEFEAYSGELARRFRLTGVANFACIFVALAADKLLLTFSNGSVVQVSTNTIQNAECTIDFAIDEGTEAFVRYSSCILCPNGEKLLLSGPGVMSMSPLLHSDEMSTSGKRILVRDCHDGPILAMVTRTVAHGEPKPLLITAGADGALRAWNESGTVLAKHTFRKNTEPIYKPENDISITSIAAATRFDSLFVVGTSTGSIYCLCLLNENGAHATSGSIEISSLGCLRLSCKAISGTLFQTDSNILAVICESDAYVVDTTLKNDSSSLIVLAHMAFGRSICVCSLWYGKYLLVSFTDQTVSAFLLTDSMCHESKLHSLDKIWTFEAHAPLGKMSRLSIGEKNFGFCATSPRSCQIVICIASGGMDSKDSFVNSKIESTHEKGIMSIEISSCGKFLATGGMDGRIILWEILHEQKTSIVELRRLNLHVGPIVSLCFSPDTFAIYSSGSDGGLFALNVALTQTSAALGTRRKNEPELKLRHVPIPGTPSMQATWHKAHEKQMRESLLLEAETHKAIQRNLLLDLRRRLEEILAKNENASPTNKLSRDELVVDVAGREKALEANCKKAEQLSQHLVDENRARNSVSDRIKRQCWDSMEVKATECHAFQRCNLLVSNFPLKNRTRQECRFLACIRTLRKLELREMVSSGASKPSWPAKSKICPPDISWIINQGELHPIVDRAESQAEAKSDLGNTSKGDQDDMEDDSEAKLREETNLDIDSLKVQLYEALSLRTSIQKRNHQTFVHELVRQVKVDFNTKFRRLYDHKRNEFDRICEKNTRIKEILTELDLEEDYFKPRFAPEETPEAVIEVTNSELESSSVSISKPGEGEPESGTINNAASKRALEDMMYGALDNKKDVDRLKAQAPAPGWMKDLDSYDDLTDAQREELEQYKVARAVFEESQEKYRKAAELEFKKLRTEVGDIARTFDEKVKNLADRRALVLSFNMTQELYMLRVCVGLIECESDVLTHSQQASQIFKLEFEKSKVVDAINNHIVSVNAATERLENLQSDDKALERNFKRDMQAERSLDLEDLKNVLSIYKDRSTLDVATEGREDLIRLDDATWRLLNASRNKKILVEAAIKDATEAVGQLKDTHTSLVLILARTETRINEVCDQQAVVRIKINAAELNLEVLVRLARAQDELEQEAVVTEYSDAILLPVNSLNIINEEISRLGDEQVKSLNKIKHFRKSINFMEWENSFLKEQARDLEEYYTDLQLLHVTKNLQSVMKGDQGITARDQLHRAEDRIAIMNRAHTKKSRKLISINLKVSQQIRSRKDENERLKQQLNELKDAVSVREAVARSRSDSLAGDLSAEQRTAHRMKRITLRRRLIDLARLQTEEIDFLRQELDRLRQRTFPSFSHATRDRLWTQDG